MRHLGVGLAVAIAMAMLSTVALAADGDVVPGSYIVVLKDNSNTQAVINSLPGLKASEVDHRYKAALDGFSADLTKSEVAVLDGDARVLSVEPNRLLTIDGLAQGRPAAFASDAEGTEAETASTQVLPFTADRIDAELSTTGSGDGEGSVDINIAVLDSGVDNTHPDLHVVGGQSCVPGNASFVDTFGHGTAVAGKAAARDNDIGVVGTAPGARLWSVRVGEEGLFSTAAILCGVDWVTQTRTDGDPTNDIAVANMSFGGYVAKDDHDCGHTSGQAYQTAVCAMSAAGVVPVAAAGNDSEPLQAIAPASFNEALTVAGMSDLDGLPGGTGTPTGNCQAQFERDDRFASFSNYATTADDKAHTVAAPAVCSLTTLLLNGCSDAAGCYGHVDGTSFAAPEVAGLVALCISDGHCAGLTPPQIIAKFVADAAAYNDRDPGYGFGGDPQHQSGNRYYGNLVNATQYVPPPPPPPPNCTTDYDGSTETGALSAGLHTLDAALESANGGAVGIVIHNLNCAVVVPLGL